MAMRWFERHRLAVGATLAVCAGTGTWFAIGDQGPLSPPKTGTAKPACRVSGKLNDVFILTVNVKCTQSVQDLTFYTYLDGRDNPGSRWLEANPWVGFADYGDVEVRDSNNLETDISFTWPECDSPHSKTAQFRSELHLAIEPTGGKQLQIDGYSNSIALDWCK